MQKNFDEMIEKIDERLIEDTIHLVNINSEQGEPKEGAPFGEGPRKVLDKTCAVWGRGTFCATDKYAKEEDDYK